MQLHKWVHKLFFSNIGQAHRLTFNLTSNQVYSNDEFDLFTQLSDSGPQGPLVTNST